MATFRMQRTASGKPAAFTIERDDGTVLEHSGSRYRPESALLAMLRHPGTVVADDPPAATALINQSGAARPVSGS
jgi:hypothetical protein